MKLLLTVLAIVAVAGASGFGGGSGWSPSSSWGCEWYFENLEVNSWLDVDSVDVEHLVVNDSAYFGDDAEIDDTLFVRTYADIQDAIVNNKLTVTDSLEVGTGIDAASAWGHFDSLVVDHILANTNILGDWTAPGDIDLTGDATLGGLKTADDGGMVDIFDRSVTAGAGTNHQGVTIETDDTDIVSFYGASSGGDGTVDELGADYSALTEITCPNGEAALMDDTLLTTDGDSIFVSGGLVWKFVVAP